MSGDDSESTTKLRPERAPGTSGQTINLKQDLKHLLSLGLEALEEGGLDDEFRYRQRRELGKGGSGVVVSVFDKKMRRVVALKRVHEPSVDAEMRARFLLEAQVTGQLAHPNVMPVYDMGTDPEGRVFFTMKQVQGRSLRQLINDSAAGSLVERLLVFRQICNALAFAHSRGVIHRDLKPGNVMVGEFGEVLVVDWGLLKLLDRPDQDSSEELGDPDLDILKTRAGEVAGTPAYMSPEQASGRLDVLDEQTDVYSLGALLYALLTDTSPFQGDTDKVLQQVRAGMFEPPANRAAGRVPRELNAIVLKAMALKKSDRYATVAKLSEDVQAYLEDRPVSVVRYSALQRLSKWAARHRRVVKAVGITSILAALALGVSGVVYVDQIGQARDAAIEEAERATAAEQVARIEAVHGRAAEAMAEALYGWASPAGARLEEVRADLLTLGADPLHADLGLGLLARNAILPRLQLELSNQPDFGFIYDGGAQALIMPIGQGDVLHIALPSGEELHRWGPVQGALTVGPVEDGMPWLLQLKDGGVEGWHPTSDRRRQWLAPDGGCEAERIAYAARRLAIGCASRGVAQWSWDDPQPQAFYPRSDPRLHVIAMSDDGRRVLVRGDKQTVMEDGRDIWTDDTRAQRVGLSPDGQWLVRRRRGGFQLVEIGTGKIHFMKSDVMSSVRWSDDSKRFQVSMQQGTIRIYEATSAGPRTLRGIRLGIPGRMENVEGGMRRLSADAAEHRWMTVVGSTVVVFELDHPGRSLIDLKLKGGAGELVRSASGAFIAVGTEDGRIIVMDRHTGLVLRAWKASEQEVRGLSFLPREDRLISGHWDGAARIWDLRTGELIREITPGDRKVTAVRVLDERRVAVGGSDGHIGIWDPETGTLLHDFTGYLNYVWDFSWNAKTQRLAASDRRPRVEEEAKPLSGPWPAPVSGEASVKLPATKGAVQAVLFDLKTASVLSQVRGEADAFNIALSPDGARLLLARGTRASLAVTIEDGGKIELPIHAPPGMAMAWSHDGLIAAGSDFSGRVQLWSTSDWEPIASVAFEDVVTAISFDQDRRTLLALTSEGAIHEVDFGGRRADLRASYRGMDEEVPPSEALRLAWRTAAMVYDWEEASRSLEAARRLDLEVAPMTLARHRAIAGDLKGAVRALDGARSDDPVVAVWLASLKENSEN